MTKPAATPSCLMYYTTSPAKQEGSATDAIGGEPGRGQFTPDFQGSAEKHVHFSSAVMASLSCRKEPGSRRSSPTRESRSHVIAKAIGTLLLTGLVAVLIGSTFIGISFA
jgi:hypothetical protein